MDKAELRRIGLNGRNGVRGERRKRYDHAIAEALVRSEAFLTARSGMADCRAGGEVDVAEAVERALQSGKTVVYPYCTGRTSMEALQPEDDGAWQTDRNGMRAPIPSRSRRVDPEDIDLVLVPCTAFDGDGNRVGMGAGCYDRFLPRCPRAQTMLVAYEAQRVAHIEPEPTDVPADQVVTEQGAARAKAGAAAKPHGGA